MNILEAGHALALAGERVDAAIQQKKDRQQKVKDFWETLIEEMRASIAGLQSAYEAEMRLYADDISALEAIKGNDKPGEKAQD